MKRRNSRPPRTGRICSTRGVLLHHRDVKQMAGSKWATVFERFPEGRLALTRSIGIFVHDWAQPVDGHPRMFDRDALEVLTTARPRIVAAVYITLGASMFIS